MAAQAPRAAMLTYYAERAAEYDSVYLKPERQADLREIEAWLPGLFAGRRVLELACGTGHWTPFLARSAAHLTAIDAVEETLRIARARQATEGVEFRVGDAYAPPALDPAPDAAFAGFWWSHVPWQRLGAFVAGLNRVLQPGARVVFIDNRFVAGSSTPVSETDAEGNTYQQRRLADGSMHRVLKNFPTEQQLREQLAGLCADLHHRAWHHYWAVDYLTPAP